MPALSAKSRQRLEGVNPVLIQIIEAAIITSPIDFGIPPDGGLRTTERQQELYAQGRTKAGKKITWVDGVTKKSKHQSGEAFDIYAYVNGAASWDANHYPPIAAHVIEVARDQFGVDLEWGGEWVKQDLPHFQLR